MQTPETIDPEYQPYLPHLIPELPLKELPQAPLKTIAEEVANRLVNITQQKSTIDLDLLAKYCCVGRIIYRDFPYSHSQKGQIRKLPGESGRYWVIQVGSDSSGSIIAEQRFTIGHEIGHIVAAKIEPLLGRIFDYQEIEEFCDTFARMLLLPRTILLQELGRMRDLDLQQLCVEIANKFNTPLEFVCKRIVEDLKLFRGIFLVIPRGNSTASWGEEPNRWISSNCPPHIFLPINTLNSFQRLIRPLSPGRRHIGVEHPKKPRWKKIYEIDVDVRSVFVGDEEIIEYAICSVRFGDKIAEVRDDYGGKYINL